MCTSILCFFLTRSYASLQAADLKWISGQGYSSGGSQLTWDGGGAGISKNVTNTGSQLTFEMGEGVGQE